MAKCRGVRGGEVAGGWRRLGGGAVMERVEEVRG